MEKVRYLMTKKELARVYVIKSLIEDKMTSRDAAEVLNLTVPENVSLKKGFYCKWMPLLMNGYPV